MSFKEYVDRTNSLSLSMRTADRTLNESVPLTSIQGADAQMIDLGKSIIAKTFNKDFPEAFQKHMMSKRLSQSTSRRFNRLSSIKNPQTCSARNQTAKSGANKLFSPVIGKVDQRRYVGSSTKVSDTVRPMTRENIPNLDN